MSTTKDYKKILQEKFTPLCVEFNNLGFKVIASTGLFNYSVDVTYRFLKHCKNIDDMVETVKNKLNNKVEESVIKQFLLKHDEYNRIYTPLVEKSKSILLINPMDRNPLFYTPQRRYNTMM